MVGTCTGALRQGPELVGYSDVYDHQQGHKTEFSPRQPCDGETLYDQHGNLESAARTQQPKQHVEEHREQQYVTADSEQLKQRYSDIRALERQLQQYSSVSAVLRQRLVDIEVARRRLLERFQLDRVLRSKEAAAKTEALDRQIRQHETEAVWRKERNSYIREEVFQILHWKLTKKNVSDALTRLHKQQDKFYKEIAPYVKADVLGRAVKRPSSLPVSSLAANQKLLLSASNAGPGGFEHAASQAGNAVVESGFPTRTFVKKGATQNGSYSTMPLADVTYSGRERPDMYVTTLLPATSGPASDQVLSQDKRPLARRLASTGFLGNGDSRTDDNKCRHPQVSKGPCVTYNSTGAADPFSSCAFSSGPSQMLQDFMHSRKSGVPTLQTAEHSCNSREPFHLQLLALRYKQEMTALELQNVSHAHPPVPRTRRCQEDCVRSSCFVESDPLSRPSSSATALLSSPWTARPHFGSVRNTDDDCSPRMQESTCSKVASPVTAIERPHDSRVAAVPSRVATTNVSITAGAPCPSRSPRCFATRGTPQRVPVSPSSLRPKSIDGASPEGPVELCSAPLILSSDTSCPRAAVARSSPPNRTSVLRPTNNSTAGANGTDSLPPENPPRARSAKREDAIKKEERVAVDVVPSVALPKGGTSTCTAIREGPTPPCSSSAQSRPSEKGSLHGCEPKDVSPTKQSCEQRASVHNCVTYEWMSPEIPTEAAVAEQRMSKEDECPASL